jgi:hypothetical protein
MAKSLSRTCAPKRSGAQAYLIREGKGDLLGSEIPLNLPLPKGEENVKPFFSTLIGGRLWQVQLICRVRAACFPVRFHITIKY